MPKQLEIDNPSYVVRVPEPAKSAEEWLASVRRAESIPAASGNGQAEPTNDGRTE